LERPVQIKSNKKELGRNYISKFFYLFTKNQGQSKKIRGKKKLIIYNTRPITTRNNNIFNATLVIPNIIFNTIRIIIPAMITSNISTLLFDGYNYILISKIGFFK
jgi:hypothetical protein